MRRWNGWGEELKQLNLPQEALTMLLQEVGPSLPQEDFARSALISKVGPSRLCRMLPCMTEDPGERLDHAHGQSFPDWVGMRMGFLPRFPDAVAYPESDSEMRSVMELADKEDLVVIPYGGGTSVVGHLEVPDTPSPVISVSLERMRRLLFLDGVSRLAGFEAGVRGVEVEAALRPRGFTLGHYPQSFEFSTLGGWVATRSSGQQSLYFGRIEDLFAGGRVLSPRGLLELSPHPASAAGPDLRKLFLGSEGRMGILTHAVVRVRPAPEVDEINGVFFRDWEGAVECSRELVISGLPLSMIRVSNAQETRTSLLLAGHTGQIRLLEAYLKLRGFGAPSHCMALIGFAGSREVVSWGRAAAWKLIGRLGGLLVGKALGRAWKRNRFIAPYLRNSLWERGYGVDTLETAVTWDRVSRTVEAVEAAIREALSPWKEKVLTFSHLSHVYPTGSSIYTTYLFRLAPSAEETLERWRAMKTAASRAILRAGGTISHQHGVGLDHKEYMGAEKGELGLRVLSGILSYVDPAKRLNPGKLVD